jgi:hypothetical protein
MKRFRGSPDTIKSAPRHDGAQAVPVGNKTSAAAFHGFSPTGYILIPANPLLTATP